MKRLLLIAALLTNCQAPPLDDDRKTLAQAAYEARNFFMCFARADRPGRLYKWSIDSSSYGWQVCDIQKREFTSDGNPDPQFESPWDDSETVWKMIRCERCKQYTP